MYLFKKLRERDYYFSINVLKIVIKNRIIIKSLKNYINEDTVNKSSDRYGVWGNVDRLNKYLGLRLTNIDLIQILSGELLKRKIYVEIGVSVMKNFFLLANNLKDSKLYAFDINLIYKPIENRFRTIEKGNPSLYNFKSNHITYYQGNVYEKNDLITFKNLFDEKINFIYSDADHREIGLLNEYLFFYKNLLDNEFLIYFDDVNSSTIPAVRKIFSSLKEEKNVFFYTFLINGWMGKNDNLHRNAIITNIDIPNILKKHRIKLKNFKNNL